MQTYRNKRLCALLLTLVLASCATHSPPPLIVPPLEIPPPPAELMQPIQEQQLLDSVSESLSRWQRLMDGWLTRRALCRTMPTACV